MSSLIKSDRDRRALILLASALALFGAYRFVIAPMTQRYGEMREEVASQRDLLAAELGLLANAKGYEPLYGHADSTFRSLAPRLFTGKDNELATIELGQYVDRIAQSSSVYVAGSDTRPGVTREDGLRRLEITVNAESDLEGVLKFLDRLESGLRLVQVTSLDIRPGTSVAGVAQNQSVLQLTATIVGFGVDTAVVRGLVAPPAADPRRRTER